MIVCLREWKRAAGGLDSTLATLSFVYRYFLQFISELDDEGRISSN